MRISRAWVVVLMLAIAYAFSFVDRQILVLLVQPIRAAIEIDDVQFSLLHGFAFAVTYAVFGLPLGWLADIGNRKYIIIFGIVVWSLATAACGLATSFQQLFSARIFVGIGEAALVPAVYSLLADLFPKDQRARPMAVFMSGSTCGAGLALWLGGFALAGASVMSSWHIPVIGVADAWRVTFMLVGLPGVALAVALMWVVREPARRELVERSTHSRQMFGTLGYLWGRRSQIIPMYLGFACFSLAVYAFSAWIPEVFRRSYQWAPQDFAMIAGPVQIGASLCGVLLSSVIIEYWQRRGYQNSALRLSVMVAALLAGLMMLFGLASTANFSLIVFGFCWFFIGFLLPAPGLVLQMILPPQRVALASALFLLVANLIGLSGGPTAVALITRYVFQSDAALGISVVVVCVLALLLSASLLQLTRKRLYIAGTESVNP
ncbi:MAG: MFS transporter [Xanthomonadales bacterium]|nr:MFS transporter [Xanthomonadales bacterium]